MTSLVENKQVEKLEDGCCQYNNEIQCYNNGQCTIENQQTIIANGCTDICLPKGCGWWAAIKCSGNLENFTTHHFLRL